MQSAALLTDSPHEYITQAHAAQCTAAGSHLACKAHSALPACCSSSPSEPAASSSPRAADPEELAAVVARLRQALPSMQVACYSSSPRGPVKASSHSVAEEVRLLCPGVLCASVQLLGPGVPYPLKVYVDAATRWVQEHTLRWRTCHMRCGVAPGCWLTTSAPIYAQ